MNELIEHKNWWQRHWKLLTGILSFLIIAIAIFFSSGLGDCTLDTARAYTDATLTKKAVELAQENNDVKQLLGTLKPIDKMALFEGMVIYSNNNNSVELTIRIKGNINKGKMDISAKKNDVNWEYKKINIRIKEPKKTIVIIPQTE